MTNYYYRVDALRLDGKAGDAVFVRAPNKNQAELAALAARPDLEGDWALTPVKITKEEYPVNTEVPELVIPPINEVITGADPENPDPLQQDAYNSWCVQYIRTALEAQTTEPNVPPRLLTRYPFDTVTDELDSRDTVSLGRHGEVVVVDTGDA